MAQHKYNYSTNAEILDMLKTLAYEHGLNPNHYLNMLIKREFLKREK